LPICAEVKPDNAAVLMPASCVVVNAPTCVVFNAPSAVVLTAERLVAVRPASCVAAKASTWLSEKLPTAVVVNALSWLTVRPVSCVVDRPWTCDEVRALKLAEESDGALVVFHDEVPRFARNAERPNPFMVRKADGASGYASTDLATALYRSEHFKADGIAIVTDFRQGDHFEQLFLTVKKWFVAKGYHLPQLHHVSFGAVTGEDGKALKTRDGGTIKLKALLDEAEERAYAVVNEKNADLPEDERRTIARVVGVGSVQYADLSQNRSSNYVFSWDKMLSLDGNTAPYLLYAVARIHSIFRKSGAAPDSAGAQSAASPVETPAEIALSRKLVQFADTIRLATDSLRPHYLCLYLYELAGAFSGFYTDDRVLVDDPAIRARRLFLCSRTALVLETGLNLLGLKTLSRM